MKTKQIPLVSIITVSFNAAKTIEQTILSVINQTYSNIEYIIIDGGSTDGTVDIIKKYEDKIAYWVSEPDKGIYDAMNKGIAKTNGEVIGIINSDDWYELDAVENVMKYFQLGNCIYHGHLNVIKDGQVLYTSYAPNILKKLKKGMIINHPTVFVSKKIYETEGAFSTSYKTASDWDFILRLYLRKYNFVKVDYVIANFNVGGVSGSISKKSLEELHTIRKNNNTYPLVDWYYLYDLLKLYVLGKYMYTVSLWKNKLFSKK